MAVALSFWRFNLCHNLAVHLLGGPGCMFPVVAEVLCHGTTGVGRQELQGSRLVKNQGEFLEKEATIFLSKV